MPHDRPTPGSSADWLARARSDLALAKVPLPEGAMYEDLCFHAQQAAEKAVKAATGRGDGSFNTRTTLQNFSTAWQHVD